MTSPQPGLLTPHKDMLLRVLRAGAPGKAQPALACAMSLQEGPTTSALVTIATGVALP